MDQIFLKLCNISISAVWLVLAVLMLRWPLKKAPHWAHCMLWGLVALRLILPVPLSSLFSLMPAAQPLPENLLLTPSPTIDSSIPLINQWINPILTEHFAPNPGDSINPMQVLFRIGSQVWLLGMIIMLLCCLISYLRLRRLVAPSLPLRTGVYVCDAITSPFILGVLRPRIYVPSSLPEEAMVCVLRHEEAHLKRMDHWWKPLGYVLLAVHWFNPVLWFAYILLCRDIEQACDEKVIAQMNGASKKGYAEALLMCSVRPNRIACCPLAFGETSVKERIRSVLNYRKPTVWILAVALILCIGAAVVLLPTAALRPSIADPTLKAWLPQAIVKAHDNTHIGDAFPCADYEVLGTERDGARTIIYARVLYAEYTPELTVQSSFCSPVVLTIHNENGKYELEEYWTPGDGPRYQTDICARFPVTLWYKATAIDTYSKAASQRLQDAARTYFFKQGISDPSLDAKWHSVVAYAGYDSSSVFADALNAHLFVQSSVRHLPLYRVDNANELNEFMQRFPELQFDQGFAEVPSFRTVTADCDEALFAENTLLIAYVPAGNPDDRYRAVTISTSDPLTINVVHLPVDGVSDSVMSGWWIITVVPREWTDRAFMLDAILAIDDSSVSLPLPELPSTVKNNRAVVTRVMGNGIVVRPDPYIHTNDKTYVSPEYFFATEDVQSFAPGDVVAIIHTGVFQWSDDTHSLPVGKLLAISKING